MKTQEIIDLVRITDPSLMHGQEAGKALAVQDAALGCRDLFMTCNAHTSYFLSKEIDPKKQTKKGILGSSHRPDSYANILAHEVLREEMVANGDAKDHLAYHVDTAYLIASETIDHWKKGKRAVHGAIGNSAYLCAYLVPAAFLAWGVSWKKSLRIFHAAILTNARTIPVAVGAGILAYIWKGYRPPFFTLLIPLAVPVAFFYGFRRMFRIFGKYKNNSRKGYYRVLREARRNGDVFGYNEFGRAIEKYWDAFLGKKPTGQQFVEAWSDKSHIELLELDVTLGKEEGRRIRQVYWQLLRSARDPAIAGAFAAHITCLFFLFRTQAASIQEDFMIALIRGQTDNGYCVNRYKAFAASETKALEEQEQAWKNNLVAYLGLVSTKKEIRLQALQARPMDLDGQLKIPRDIDPETLDALYAAYRAAIERSPDALDTQFRYWWLLQAFKQKEAEVQYAIIAALSPHRMEMEKARFKL